MIKTIIELEEEVRAKYFKYREVIHRNPELSGQEEKTAALVSDVLEGLGIKVRTGVGGHGVVGILEGKSPGRVVGLRADMDALPICEKNEIVWQSEIEGVMHACGHDTHTAMLLGVAHVLVEMRDCLVGTVVFIFQPAEENSPTGGAPSMIAEGVLDDPKIDAMLGLHVWPTLKTGTIGLQAGPVSAASDPVKITVCGKAAHASMPNYGVDAIVIGSAMVMSLQTIVSRNVSANESAVLTLGTVKGGDRYNIVADKVNFEGTVRTFDPVVRKTINRLIHRIACGTCESLGGSCEIDYQFGYPSSINDPGITAKAQRAASKLLGEENLLISTPVNPAGEDFAFFAEKVPSAFAWLGCCPEDVPLEEMPPLHNDEFLPDEKALPVGVRYLATATLEILQA